MQERYWYMCNKDTRKGARKAMEQVGNTPVKVQGRHKYRSKGDNNTGRKRLVQVHDRKRIIKGRFQLHGWRIITF